MLIHRQLHQRLIGKSKKTKIKIIVRLLPTMKPFAWEKFNALKTVKRIFKNTIIRGRNSIQIPCIKGYPTKSG